MFAETQPHEYGASSCRVITGFIVAHAIGFTVWIGYNFYGLGAFDQFPFSLLNLIVSLEAIILTSFVLMTQNRMSRLADRRAHLDLQGHPSTPDEMNKSSRPRRRARH